MSRHLCNSGPDNIGPKHASRLPTQSPSTDNDGTRPTNGVVWQNLRLCSRRSILTRGEFDPPLRIARSSEIEGFPCESPARPDRLAGRLPGPRTTKRGFPPSSSHVLLPDY